jgi:hypothetical protein
VLALVKALPFGVGLTLLVALFVGSGGSSGGVLEVVGVTFEGMRFYWSWWLFCLGTALAWALLIMMGN